MFRISVNNTCKSLLQLNTVQSNTTCRFIHIVRRTKHTTLKNALLHNSNRSTSQILNTFFVRHASTNETIVNNVKKEPELIRIDLTNNTTVNKEDELFEIPDIPPIPVEEIVEVIKKVHSNGEIMFESLGLGGYSPVGLIQNSMEWMHIYMGLPWWGTIALGTVIVRTFMFPLIIKSQKNAAAMSLYLPKMTEIQQKLSEARMSGDHYNAAAHSNELYMYMKEKNMSPWKSLIPLMVQVPTFLSFYLALRGMAQLPVESFTAGGLWWFTNLSVPDPYYILPFITAATLAVTIEVGTDAAGTAAMGSIKYVLRCMPIVTLPFAIQLPSAVLVYWAASNFYSLIQITILRTPYMRKRFNLPEIVKHKPTDIIAKKGFVKGIKETWNNMKVAKQLADRDNMDTVNFNKAGRGPVIKTYSYDPTKINMQPKIMTKSK